MESYNRITSDVKLGREVVLASFINLYGCEVGDRTKLGTFVEIQKGAVVGKDCKISTHTFICEGVTIQDGVFVGHGVTFINDKYPPGYEQRWRASGGARLEGCLHDRKEGSVHWIGINHYVWSYHWGESHCRGRKYGDKVYSPRRNLGRQSR